MNGVVTSNSLMVEEIKQKMETGNVQFLLASFSDINGSSRAKLVPSKRLSTVLESGAGFAGFAVGDLGHGPTDPDILCIPDLRSMTILPWQKDLAWFAGTLTEDGSPWSYCTRTILLNVMEKAKKLGYEMKTGVEPEFSLLKEGDQGTITPADPFDVANKPCYNQVALMRNYDFLSTLIGYMEELEWDVSQADHEDANGQFEVNFEFADVLTSADRLMFFKYMVRSMAEERNLVATFMPKPFSHLTGNGCHMHLSLWNGSQNLFKNTGDPKGNELSELGYHFIGGILKHAKSLTAIVCPTVNSYKRLTAMSTSSGATWAPNLISYGGNNRTQLVRCPGAGRIEFRAMDNHANPYLASAAILAAGLDGIEKKVNPDLIISENSELESVLGNEIGKLPSTLQEAIIELEENEVLIESLGHDFMNTYIKRKKEEWAEYNEKISSWEIEKYLKEN
ncbi:type III glutamate--ammonia ligase [Alkalihalobacillus sp. MEB130]|uniref:type III glutamate--ammonia ligase n=1 Tax=Alkalihalobacillus sp. MEB130 TaxID=2976704 RepID=UPI0028E03667|nr:type III glutamate--ammonia ligase [Alkalihalobacillus sp. MEB130]MDT8861360.1 type III glutamate--ammonia ligase [Alkalihalobacillus sp. MEB130]